MIKSIENKENKNKVAIVVVGYNRFSALSRLLISLEEAEYPSSDIPLVISIDCSGDERVYNLAREFKWSHGEKCVNIEKKRLGLVKHIYQCGDMTKYFRAIVLLEDDLFVAPYFYSYVLQALENYGDNDSISQIALYHNETNGFVKLPFQCCQTGADVVLHQSTCTWGQCWNERMWKEFCQWRDTECTDELINAQDMPERIKGWTRAWSRFFDAFICCNNKFVVYPMFSVSTNFNDAGEHGAGDSSGVQVNLQQGDLLYRMPPIEQLVKYDSFWNNLSIPEWLSINLKDICLDLYGCHPLNKQRYILSIRKLPYKVLKGYALNLRPIELNIKYGIEGKGIYLYDTTQPGKGSGKYDDRVGAYFLKGFDIRLMPKYIIHTIVSYIKLKMR